MNDDFALDLPRPFYDEWFSRQSAAHALWHWHSALVEPTIPAGVSPESYFDEERARAEAAEPLRVVAEDIWSGAYEACQEYDLDLDLLGAQVEAARLFHGSTRFETADRLETFVRLWAAPHARLLARLAGLTNSVQMAWVDELARGFFHFAHLVRLPADLDRDRLFIPLDELEQAGVTVEQLEDGRVDESVRRLLWKQSVRTRDALAQGRALLRDLSVRKRYALKRYWHGMLAYLKELERREYDLWSEPIDLSLFRKVQVYLQVVFGRVSA